MEKKKHEIGNNLANSSDDANFFFFKVLSGGEFGSGSENSTTNSNKIKHCGANFCVLGNGGHETLERPPESEIYEISAIYLSCVIVAVIIVALFVDPLSR